MLRVPLGGVQRRGRWERQATSCAQPYGEQQQRIAATMEVLRLAMADAAPSGRTPSAGRGRAFLADRGVDGEGSKWKELQMKLTDCPAVRVSSAGNKTSPCYLYHLILPS